MGGLAESNAGYSLAAAGAPSGQATPKTYPANIRMCDKSMAECNQRAATLELQLKTANEKIMANDANYAAERLDLEKLRTVVQSREVGGKASLNSTTIAKLQERDVIQRRDLDITYQDGSDLRKELKRLQAILKAHKIDFTLPNEPEKPAPIPQAWGSFSG